MRARRGFTLIEVLAAVAFVGLVFTALSRSATVGIISEGDNRRRMEAAMLADAEMTRIEIGLQNLQIPAEGTTEQEIDDFLVVTEVTPWVPPADLADAITEVSPQGMALFGDTIGGKPSLVLEVAVRVEWFDGVEDNLIERVTLAVNHAPMTAGLAGGSPALGR